MRIYMGYDPREDVAYGVAERSLHATSYGVDLHPVRLDRLRAAGLYTRPTERRDGKLWDVASEAPMSTEFAISRFFVFCMQMHGVSLFVDCDVLFLSDVNEIMEEFNSLKAVQVVKHAHTPTTSVKMDDQVQTVYPRKNWSSVMLINHAHPAHRRLNIEHLNYRPGRDLHRFFWLRDDEIGELAPRWNWLVGEQPMPSRPAIAHYTMGVPVMPGYENSPHAQLWWDVHNRTTFD